MHNNKYLVFALTLFLILSLGVNIIIFFESNRNLKVIETLEDEIEVLTTEVNSYYKLLDEQDSEIERLQSQINDYDNAIHNSSTQSENVCTYVSYLEPKVKKDDNMGALLPEINYESKHIIIFSHGFGIFIYDLDTSKMERAIKLQDSKFHLGMQGDTTAVVQVDNDKQLITIHEIGYQPQEYYYKYDINNDKLYKCQIEHLETNIKPPEVTGRMYTTDWSAWNLIYTSKLTGKTYYPFRDIIE